MDMRLSDREIFAKKTSEFKFFKTLAISTSVTLFLMFVAAKVLAAVL